MMTMLDDLLKFEQLVRRMEPQSRLLRAWPLRGFSARITALEVLRPDGQAVRMVVRQHGPVDLAANPKIAADEYRLLKALRAAGVAAPTPYYVDPGDVFATPCIVVAYIDGETDFAPADLGDYLRQYAEQLACIHRVDHTALDFLPPQPLTRPENPGEPAQAARIRATLAAHPPPQRSAPVLLHGDYWPGNVLWNEGRLVAVIDWEDAKTGDPLADLAISRLDVCLIFGPDAVRVYTHHYLSLATVDVTALPYWDLYAALRAAPNIGSWSDGYDVLGRPDITEQTMRDAYEWFVAQAFENLTDF